MMGIDGNHVRRLCERIAATVLAFVLCAAASVALAQSPAPNPLARYTGTLKKINDSGVVTLGYRENSPPFAFLDPDRKPVGYSLDLCEIVLEEIGNELGRSI